MKKNVKNAKEYPTTYYIRHIEPGLVYYKEFDQLVLVTNSVLKKMDKTLINKPIYLEHIDSEKDHPAYLEQNFKGVIVDSFFNELDGWYYAKAIIWDDEAKQRIKEGWKVSNAYVVKQTNTEGGVYHDIKYSMEVLDGEYNHIAIVKNPRYENTEIFTEEEYNEYLKNLQIKIQNSKKREKIMNWKIFKKQYLNEKDFEDKYVDIQGIPQPVSLDEIIGYYKKMFVDKYIEENSLEEERKKETKEEEKEEKEEKEDKVEVEKVEDCNDGKIKNSKKEEVIVENAKDIENKDHFTNIKKNIDNQMYSTTFAYKIETLQDKIERGKEY